MVTGLMTSRDFERSN